MNDLYFWNGTEVIKSSDVTAHFEMPCVDPFDESPRGRYGKFIARGFGWIHIPLEDFDPIFRTHLLLLGIT